MSSHDRSLSSEPAGYSKGQRIAKAHGRRDTRRRLSLERLETRELLFGNNVCDFVPSPMPTEVADTAPTAWNREPAAEGENAAPFVRFRLAATDSNGNPLSTLTVGQNFELRAYVQDLRGPGATGVFSPYLDVQYPQDMVQISGAIRHAATYANLASGNTAQPGLIDEAGGFGDYIQLDSNEYLVFSVPFVARKAGAVQFQSDAADRSPDHDLFVYGSFATVPANLVDYVNTSLSVIQVVDNDSAVGFQKYGKWSRKASGGYLGAYQYSSKGSGKDAAIWSFPVPPGVYWVAATWSPAKSWATNAPFTIYDGAVPISTVALNQEWAPNDFSAGGVGWERIGSFPVVIANGQLVVTLTDKANDNVVADAVRLESVAAPQPQIELRAGATPIADGGTINLGTAWAGVPVDKVITVRNVGTGVLSLVSLRDAAWPPGVSLVGDLGSLLLVPGASTQFTLRMQSLDLINIGGESVVLNSNQAAQGFRFSVSGNVVAAPAVQIVDDGDPGFAVSGSWKRKTNSSAYGKDYMSSTAGEASFATWTFNVTPGHVYRISTTWMKGRSAATNALFTLFDGAKALNYVAVNQQLAPSENGWQTLGGPYFVSDHQIIVKLTGVRKKEVMANTVRIELVS